MTEPATPRISVVMPVYNAATYLEAAIDSILAQSFRDFELIALDDGSTDASPDILARLAARDSRVRGIRHENRGVTPTLNAGLHLARGSLIARMDSDDIALPDRFAKQVAYLEAHPKVLALGGQFLLIDPAGRPLRILTMPLTHDEIDARHIGGTQMGMCHPSVMMRRDAVLSVGGYREAFETTQDIDLWLRLAEIGQIANLPDTILHYRQHAKSIGYTKRELQRKFSWQAMHDAAVRRGLPTEALPPPVAARDAQEADVYRKWAWWALSGGHPATARVYAAKALMQQPFKAKNWHLAACAVRGR